MTDIGNQLLKLIDDLTTKPIRRFSNYQIRGEQCSGVNIQEIKRNVDYFTIRVSEAIFTNSNYWESRNPVVVAFTEYLYANRKVIVPRILIPSKATLDGPRSFTLRDTQIAGPHPFRGDQVSIRAIVFSARSKKYDQHLIEIAQAISAAVEPSIYFETLSKIGNTLIRCLHFMLTNGDLRPILEGCIEIDTSGINGFASGFWLLTASRDLKVGEFGVHDGKLSGAQSAGMECDYLLLEVLAMSKQESKVKSPFFLLRDQALEAVATDGDEGWIRAKAYLLTAYQQMLLSGDLTSSEVESLFDDFSKAIMAVRDKREAIVSLGSRGAKSGATGGLAVNRAVRALRDLDRRTIALNKQLSVAEMADFVARVPSLGRGPFSSGRLSETDVRHTGSRVSVDSKSAESIGDTIECSVFGPPAVPPGESALVQVFLHLPEQAERASFLASAMDSSATWKSTRSLEIEIKRGATVEISLAVNELVIDEPAQSVVWQGQPAFCQFLITIPAGTSGHSFFPVVRVSINGTLVGCIKFRISADSSAAGPQSSPLGDHARRYEKAFVSYATKDRKEVLKRVQMLNVLKTNFFLDLLSLGPGDRWEKKLYENIGDCDLFLLFWSQAAKESLWVIQEVEYALKQQQQSRNGEPDIVPVILEQNVLPPRSLAALHFNDRIQYLISLVA